MLTAIFVCLFVCCSVVEQCICHRIQEDDMVCEWMAYNSRNPKPLTMNTLEQFEHEVKAGHRSWVCHDCSINVALQLFHTFFPFLTFGLLVS